MTIPRLARFNFLFNNGRGINPTQIDWDVTDAALNAFLAGLTGSGNRVIFSNESDSADFPDNEENGTWLMQFNSAQTDIIKIWLRAGGGWQDSGFPTLALGAASIYNAMNDVLRGSNGNTIEQDAANNRLRIAGQFTHILSAAPDDANGRDGDRAIARLSATELAGYTKASGTWTQVWTFSGGGGGGSHVGRRSFIGAAATYDMANALLTTNAENDAPNAPQLGDTVIFQLPAAFDRNDTALSLHVDYTGGSEEHALENSHGDAVSTSEIQPGGTLEAVLVLPDGTNRKWRMIEPPIDLTKGQVQDLSSELFGVVSGQRLMQAVARFVFNTEDDIDLNTRLPTHRLGAGGANANRPFMSSADGLTGIFATPNAFFGQTEMLEELQDRIAAMFTGNASVTYDDANGTLTITTAGGLSAVVSDGSLNGNGTSGSPLNVDVEFLFDDQDETGTTFADNYEVLFDQAGTLWTGTLGNLRSFLVNEARVYALIKDILQAGNNVEFTENDNNRELTIAATGGGGDDGDAQVGVTRVLNLQNLSTNRDGGQLVESFELPAVVQGEQIRFLALFYITTAGAANADLGPHRLSLNQTAPLTTTASGYVENRDFIRADTPLEPDTVGTYAVDGPELISFSTGNLTVYLHRGQDLSADPDVRYTLQVYALRYGGHGAGVTDYDDLTDKPIINGDHSTTDVSDEALLFDENDGYLYRPAGLPAHGASWTLRAFNTSDLGAGQTFEGYVDTYQDLPTTSLSDGDTYFIRDPGAYGFWTWVTANADWSALSVRVYGQHAYPNEATALAEVAADYTTDDSFNGHHVGYGRPAQIYTATDYTAPASSTYRWERYETDVLANLHSHQTQIAGIEGKLDDITDFRRYTQDDWDALADKPAAGIISFVRA